MKVLVTGGAGFIGSHLCERMIEEGIEPVCIDNFNDYYDPSLKRANVKGVRMKVHEADIRDREGVLRIFKLEKPDKVVHLAAMAGVRYSIENPMLYNDVNVTGTINLLEAARSIGIRHFIFGGSSSVYGMNTKVPFSESDSTDRIISPYAATKRIGEECSRVYSSLYGMNITSLRFFTVYGPRCRPDLAAMKFMIRIREGKEIEMYGDGSTMRDYTYVADIVDGIMAALGKEFAFEIINLGDSKPIMLSEMISTIEEALGRKARIIQKPIPQGDVEKTFADISKAERLLGYRPKVPFKDGIGLMAEWFRRER
jgi:UDP-glucuronate 4-epimerase